MKFRPGNAAIGNAMMGAAIYGLGRKLVTKLGNRTKSNVTKVGRPPRQLGRRKAVAGRRNRPRNYKNITSQGSGVASHSSCKTYSRGTAQNRLIARIGSPNSWVSQSAIQTQTPAGFQTAGYFSWVSNANLQSIQQSAGNALVWNPTNGNAPMRYVYEGVFGEIAFTNATNHAIDLDIYDLYLKRDVNVINSYALVDASNTVTVPTWTGPTGAWELGVNNANNFVDPANSAFPTPNTDSFYNYVGSSPFDSQLFKDYFGVQKRTHIAMPLGATHRHHCNFHLEKMVDSRMTQNVAVEGWKGFTRYTMWVIRGYPVNSDPHGGTADVTTAGAYVNVIRSQRAKFTYVLDNRQQVKYIDNLVSLVDDQVAVMNIASGVIENEVNTNDNFP